MSALERELVERISRLDEEKQKRVLEFVQHIEKTPEVKQYTARELMKLPKEVRRRIMAAAFELAANEDFEIFEAYGEEDWDEPT